MFSVYREQVWMVIAEDNGKESCNLIEEETVMGVKAACANMTPSRR